MLRPALVTGLKHWHLRPESNFYPKKNFERYMVFNTNRTCVNGRGVFYFVSIGADVDVTQEWFVPCLIQEVEKDGSGVSLTRSFRRGVGSRRRGDGPCLLSCDASTKCCLLLAPEYFAQ